MIGPQAKRHSNGVSLADQLWPALFTAIYMYVFSVGLLAFEKRTLSKYRPGPEVIFFMLNSAEHEVILLINVKMLTIVGNLTFISMVNATSERLKARQVFVCRYFSFSEQLKFRAQLS